MVDMEIDEGKIINALNWAYGHAVQGLPGMESAEEMAASYIRSGGTRYEQANALIRWQIAKAGTSGFVSGLGGVLTIPVTVPANIASVFYIQLRMIAAIAHIGGYDVHSDQVRTLAYACLCGSVATEILKKAGITIGTKVTQQLIRKISFEVIKSINKAWLRSSALRV
jgi:EcsC protein family